MKKTLSITFILLLFIGSAFAAEMKGQAMQKVESAMDVIGRSVETPEGETLGTITDIVLDEGTGRIAYAVISMKRSPLEWWELESEELGYGKIVAVPWKALDIRATTAVLDIDREKFENAPAFSKDKMADMSWASRVHEYYGLRPFWEETPGMMPKE